MDEKLVSIKDKERYELCAGDEVIVDFGVEINKDTALISYETKEAYRHKGFGSLGLNVLKQELFSDNSILYLELINLSGDYSRKVAENAGFFSLSNSLDYFITINPRAEEIIEGIDATIANKEIFLEKLRNRRQAEIHAKEKLQNKLDSLLKEKELDDEMPSEYKKYLESEISHLEGVLNGKYNQDKITRQL